MSTKALPQPGVTEIRPIAHPLHTLALLTIQVLMAVRGIFQAKQMQVPRSSNVGLYIRTIVIEWMLFAIVLAGVWFAGSPLSTVLGERFRSARDILRTVGIDPDLLPFCLLCSTRNQHVVPRPGQIRLDRSANVSRVIRFGGPVRAGPVLGWPAGDEAECKFA